MAQVDRRLDQAFAFWKGQAAGMADRPAEIAEGWRRTDRRERCIDRRGVIGFAIAFGAMRASIENPVPGMKNCVRLSVLGINGLHSPIAPWLGANKGPARQSREG
jgi:hypothetical protein